MRLKLTAWVALVLIGGVLVAPRPTSGQEKADVKKGGVDAKTAFKRIKTLAGTWKGQISGEHQKEEEDHHKGEKTVTYKLTGAGSALVETQFPGEPHEMVSVYHLDGDDLRMTHYCAMGNQPRVKLDRVHSTPDQLIFVFDGGTNLDPQKDTHIHGVTITFHKDGKVDSAWEGYQGGKSAGTTTFALSRQ
jgi:hypothetical protein